MAPKCRHLIVGQQKDDVRLGSRRVFDFGAQPIVATRKPATKSEERVVNGERVSRVIGIVVSWMDERVNAAKGRTGILPV